MQGKFDPTKQHFSVAGQNLNMDLANPDIPTANASIFWLGDGVPFWTGQYQPRTSLISEYLSFLHHAMANDLVESMGSPSHPTAPTTLRQLGRNSRSLPFNIGLANLLTGLSLHARAEKFAHNIIPTGNGTDLVQAVADCWAALDLQPNTMNMPVALSTGTTHTSAPLYSMPTMCRIIDDWKQGGSPPPAFATDAPPSGSIPIGSNCFALPDLPFLTAEISAATLGFSGITAAPIAPGAWFQIDLLTKYRSIATGLDFFGESGGLALLPEFAILGYQAMIPTPTDVLSRVGPFMLNALTSQSPRIVPILLGLVSRIL